MKNKAVIFGATGLTGGYLLEMLLQDDFWGEVVAVGRTAPKANHSKLKIVNADLLAGIDLVPHLKDVHSVFVCIGTTQAKTPDNETYEKIDYGIPVKVAKAAKEAGVGRYLVVSAMGANAGSRIFYNRLKGRMERDVKANGPDCYIFRPSLIVGTRNEKRTGERLATALMKTFDFFIPKKYRATHAQTIAKAMHFTAKDENAKSRIIENKEIRSLG